MRIHTGAPASGSSSSSSPRAALNKAVGEALSAREAASPSESSDSDEDEDVGDACSEDDDVIITQTASGAPKNISAKTEQRQHEEMHLDSKSSFASGDVVSHGKKQNNNISRDSDFRQDKKDADNVLGEGKFRPVSRTPSDKSSVDWADKERFGPVSRTPSDKSMGADREKGGHVSRTPSGGSIDSILN
jgi:hypothetical protein